MNYFRYENDLFSGIFEFVYFPALLVNYVGETKSKALKRYDLLVGVPIRHLVVKNS